MVAHGTIAFDTLTTSDQVRTGTEKSIDTSYLLNGSTKQWVNFNGSGTVAIRLSLNTSSITDSGTGHYGINFTSAMSASEDPACVTGKTNADSNAGNATTLYMSSSSQMFLKIYENNSAADATVIAAATFGDLA